MVRFALYACSATLLLGAVAAQAQTAPPGYDPDMRQLRAALVFCQHFAEQSRRDRCEMQARKTDGAEVRLSRGANEPEFATHDIP